MKYPLLARILALAFGLAVSVRAADSANEKYPDLITLKGKNGPVIHCVVQKYSAAELTIKIAGGKDGVSITLPMETVETMTIAQDRSGVPAKEEKEPAYADTIVLTGDSTIHCTVKSVTTKE